MRKLWNKRFKGSVFGKMYTRVRCDMILASDASETTAQNDAVLLLHL